MPEEASTRHDDDAMALARRMVGSAPLSPWQWHTLETLLRERERDDKLVVVHSTSTSEWQDIKALLVALDLCCRDLDRARQAQTDERAFVEYVVFSTGRRAAAHLLARVRAYVEGARVNGSSVFVRANREMLETDRWRLTAMPIERATLRGTAANHLVFDTGAFIGADDLYELVVPLMQMRNATARVYYDDANPTTNSTALLETLRDATLVHEIVLPDHAFTQ